MTVNSLHNAMDGAEPGDTERISQGITPAPNASGARPMGVNLQFANWQLRSLAWAPMGMSVVGGIREDRLSGGLSAYRYSVVLNPAGRAVG